MAFNKVVADFADETLVTPIPLASPGGMNFDIGFDASLSGTGTDYAVTGPTGDIDVLVRPLGFLDLQIDATGAARDINLLFQSEASAQVDVTARRVGDVTMKTTGAGETSGSAFIRAEDGGIGDIKVVSKNPNGNAFLDASAFSGDIGNIALSILAGKGSADVSAYASGGDVGNVLFTNSGGSGSGDVHVDAIGALNSNGNGIGGNVGNIKLENFGGLSGDVSASVSAYAIASGDVYEGGGKVGNIVLKNFGASGSASAEVSVTGVTDGDGDYLGGGKVGDILLVNRTASGSADMRVSGFVGASVGDIEMVSKLDPGSYSGSTQVNIDVFGASGKAASVGDIEILSRGARGSDNSAGADVSAFGGNIGDISGLADGKGAASGEFDLFLTATNQAGIGGGRIGDIKLANKTWAGDTNIDLFADRRIGDIDIDQTGGGSANARIVLEGSGDMGDIAITFGKRHSGSGGLLSLGLEDGVDGGTVGDVVVAGGTRNSTFGILDAEATSVGKVDFSAFKGSALIELSDIDTGTTIRASQRGSTIEDTEGADRIHLGAFADTVTVAGNAETDRIFDFRVDGPVERVDMLGVVGAADFEAVLTTNPGATVVDGGDIFGLVDIAGGNDIWTGAGLLAALNGGEYGNLNATANSTATILTAKSGTATKFKVYEVVENTADANYDTATLVAIVKASDPLSALDQGNFFSV